MTRSDYILNLLMKNKLEAALNEMVIAARGSYSENGIIHLYSRYSGLKTDIQSGTLSYEARELRANQIRNAVQSMAKELESEASEKMQEEVTVRETDSDPDPVFDIKPSIQKEQHFHFHGSVGSVNTDNQGHIVQNIDMSTNKQTIEQNIENFQQLLDAQQNDGFITRDEYEDLLDLLEEIKETKEPGTRQQSRWKRVLGKAVTKSKEFMGKRIEKGSDTLLSEGVKKYVSNGGLDQILEFVSSAL